MNSRLPVLLLLTAAVTLAAPAAAPLTLDECLAAAAANHPVLTAAAAGVSAATAAVGEARAPFYPHVDFSASYHRWQRRAFLPAGLTIPGRDIPDIIGPLDDWNGGVLSHVTLYDFGERRSALEAARARLAGAEADSSATQADVQLNIRAAFYALAAAQELNAVAEKNLSRAAAHQRLAEARKEAGAVPEADVLRTQAEVANARLQLISARSRVQVATGRLNTAMGRAAETPLAIATGATALATPDRNQLDAAVANAIARRPEIAAGQKRTDAARSAVAAARAARAPKLRADAAFGLRDTALWPDTREWQAGVSIDFPVFDAGSRARRLARSRAELAREEATVEARRLQVRDEAWAAAAEVERTWAAIAASETSVRAHEESLRVVQERYERGATVITDLLDTQIALARAESSLAEARWSYLAARAFFDRAVGAGP